MKDAVQKILTSYKTWAVVGCSPDPNRDSHGVAFFLQKRGYEIISINPNCDEVLGERCYPDLASVPDDRVIEVVDVFRRADVAPVVVQEAIDRGAKAVWMQLGVISQEAFDLATDAGLDVVMDRCPKLELPRLS